MAFSKAVLEPSGFELEVIDTKCHTEGQAHTTILEMPPLTPPPPTPSPTLNRMDVIV